MTSRQVRTGGAVVLIVAGLACVGYALASLGTGGPPVPGVASEQEASELQSEISAEEVSDGASPVPPGSKAEKARRRAMILWATVALPLLFLLLFVALLAIRRMRPGPLRRGGPSDTTDLWREAGKRLKLK